MPTELYARKRVPPERLRRRVEPGAFGFQTTAEICPLRDTIGQDRAVEAIRTGLALAAPGFHIFVSGPIGSGRNSTLRTIVAAKAKERPTPSDWCYIYNFQRPDEPRALSLPPGRARELAQAMDAFIETCQRELPKAFAGAEYGKRRGEAIQHLNTQREQILRRMQERARKLSHAVQLTPGGIFAVPLVKDRPVSPEDFERLDPAVQEELRQKARDLQQVIEDSMAQIRALERQAAETTLQLDRQIALFAVGHLIQGLTEQFAPFAPVVEYLRQVQEDVINNIEMFRQPEPPAAEVMGMKVPVERAFYRYRVNVVVDHAETQGAPVIDERNPSYYNLLGSLEYRSQFGGMITDFTLVKAGAIQRANGGYLILQAIDLLREPLSWEALKRTLRTGQAKIENMWEQYRPVPAVTLRPEPIPVDLKVVIVGPPALYPLLLAHDDGFRRLFKIRAEFDTQMELSEEHLNKYAAFASARCAEAQLPPCNREAVAALAEHGVRLAEHRGRLSTCFMEIAEVLTEAGYRARQENAAQVDARHVRDALDAHRRRSRLVQDKIQEAIEEGSLLIDTDAAVPGQVNGLTVYDLGDYRFGRPTRITCVTSIGRDGVVNIERESHLSGNIHSKGVLILSGYLAGHFGQDKSLALSASLTFEQSYAPVEGDSASVAELCALLSSLSGIPLRQEIAVTGSVDQRGQVQPIGAVNEKIEGFFEVCQKRGLTGRQGVLIPARNLVNLMLREEVVAAVRDGRFHIYAVDTVEEAVEILTAIPAGARDEHGDYPSESVFGRVDRRLREMGEVLKPVRPRREKTLVAATTEETEKSGDPE